MSSRSPLQVGSSEVAIIGMAGRLPGARDLRSYWRNLCEGVESIRFFSEEEVIAAGVDPALVRRRNYVKAAATIDDVDLFDPGFFGLNQREAEITDPQQRLFLESAWEALENAGYDPERYRGAIGVFGGVGFNTYLLNNLLRNPKVLDVVGLFQAALANQSDYLATRVAYKLNLRGPAVTIGTACSTSLVAVHLACQSLIGFECDMALAGGSSVKVPQKSGYLHQEGGIVSPDGHCRAFDARAQGTVLGSGVGVVVLRRLEDALKEGDRVHAVIKGSAVNNDGSQKVGFTAPSVSGQARVITEALGVAGVPADSIGYVEAHGTGTALGDPIEIEALSKVFRRETSAKQFCFIGSVKSNIGHVDAAAGAAGLIKAVFALENGKIPPSLHYKSPNPEMHIADSPFHVPTSLVDWRSRDLPRRAAVSAFGFGGTNAHLILEEAPRVDETGPSRPCQLLTLSARNEEALEAMTDGLRAALQQDPELALPDVAFTLQVGRRIFSHRRIVVCRGRDAALSVLGTRDSKALSTFRQTRQAPDVAFMFPGQGAQYAGMARDLFETERVFREQVTRCCELLAPLLGLDLVSLLYPPPGEAERAGESLKQTHLAQPAIFVISFALARLWMSWGVRPQALIGHSVGEYAAACVSGVMSLETALGLVAARGRLMGSLPAGSMVAVALTPEKVEPLLDDGLVIAAFNTPGLCVLSGTSEAIERFEKRAASHGTKCRKLHTSHGFHSPMMDPILSPFEAEVARARLVPPEIPIVSTVTGKPIRAEEATDPRYWARNLRQPVRFADGVARLLERNNLVLLEVGPGNTLGSFALQNPARAEGHTVLASVRPPRDPQSDWEFLTTTLGKLWLAGVEPDWSRYYGDEKRRRVPLPGYPFQRKRCWVDPDGAPEGTAANEAVHAPPSPAKRSTASWLSTAVWRSEPLADTASLAIGSTHCLVLFDGGTLGEELVDRLRLADAKVNTAVPGVRYASLGSRSYEVDPRTPTDYEALIRALAQRNELPDVVVVLGTPPGAADEGPANRRGRVGHEALFEAPMFLARAMLPRKDGRTLRLLAVTHGVHAWDGTVPAFPQGAIAFGPCRVIPQEYSRVECRHVDLDAATSTQDVPAMAGLLLAELSATVRDRVVVYRGGTRFIQAYERVPFPLPEGRPAALREGGVYLVLGGLGGIGLVVARYLARACRARLVLVSRAGLPDRIRWRELLEQSASPSGVRRQISEIEAMEARGAEVLVCRADVTDPSAMSGVKRAAEARFGRLNGIVHAAGAPGSGLVRTATREGTDAVLSPRVTGALLLRDLFAGAELDFVVFCSSIASVLGGLGQADYCAASCFLDSFAHGRPFGDGTAVTSIDWPAWREVGIAAASPIARDPSLSIGTDEAIEVLARILHNPRPRVLVTPEIIERLIDRTDALPPLDPPPTAGVAAVSLVGAAVSAGARHAPASGEDLETRLARLWTDLLGVPKIEADDNFLDLGGNSLIAIRLFESVEREIGVRLPVAAIFQAPTVRRLAEVIRNQAPGEREQPSSEKFLVDIKSAGARPPMFLVHALGGGILSYHKLAEYIAGDRPVLGLVARGVDGRQDPLTRVEEMAAHYIRDILDNFPEGPYHLGGYSFGAQVAYEMARQLMEQGRSVGLLAIFDQAPANAKGGLPWTPSSMKNFLVSQRYWWPLLVREGSSDIATRLQSRFRIIRKMIEVKLKQSRSEPIDVSVHDVRDMSRIPVLRHRLVEAEFHAHMEYHPKPCPGKVTLFRAMGQGVFTRHDTELGWTPLAEGGVETHHIPGSHLTILYEPHVRELAARLNACLERAESAARLPAGQGLPWVTGSRPVRHQKGSGTVAGSTDSTA